VPIPLIGLVTPGLLDIGFRALRAAPAASMTRSPSSSSLAELGPLQVAVSMDALRGCA